MTIEDKVKKSRVIGGLNQAQLDAVVGGAVDYFGTSTEIYVSPLDEETLPIETEIFESLVITGKKGEPKPNAPRMPSSDYDNSEFYKTD